MSPTQRAALEALAGRALHEHEAVIVAAHLASGEMQSVADVLSLRHDGSPRMRTQMTRITERSVRALPGVPRHRHALLSTLRSAATQDPAWLEPTLAAAGVPPEDRPAYADDLACAWRWLLSDGIDVGDPAARRMLDLIAAAVPLAAPACAEVKAMAEVPDPIDHLMVSKTLDGVE